MTPLCDGSPGNPGSVLLGVHEWTETLWSAAEGCDCVWGGEHTEACPVPRPIQMRQEDIVACRGCDNCDPIDNRGCA